jgi:hypothetical protein
MGIRNLANIFERDWGPKPIQSGSPSIVIITSESTRSISKIQPFAWFYMQFDAGLCITGSIQRQQRLVHAPTAETWSGVQENSCLISLSISNVLTICEDSKKHAERVYFRSLPESVAAGEGRSLVSSNIKWRCHWALTASICA